MVRSVWWYDLLNDPFGSVWWCTPYPLSLNSPFGPVWCDFYLWILFGPFGPVWWCDLWILFGPFLDPFGSKIFIFDTFGPMWRVCWMECNNKYANLSSALWLTMSYVTDINGKQFKNQKKNFIWSFWTLQSLSLNFIWSFRPMWKKSKAYFDGWCFGPVIFWT